MNHSKKRGQVFGVPRCNTAPLFQVKKGILNQMTVLIERSIVLPLHQSISLGWNNRLYPCQSGSLENIIACPQLAACTFYPERHAMHIHGQMQCCVEPYCVRLIAWLPSLAPLASG
jgi:hypothetical protein